MRILTFPRRHWRGALSPAAAILGVLLAGRLAVWWLWSLAPSPLPPVAFALALTGDAAVLVWQVAGSWRSIRRVLEGDADSVTVWGAQGAVIGLAIVALTGLSGHVARQAQPPPGPATLPLPLATLDGAVLIEGAIDFALLARFDATALAGLDTVRLSSPGGLIYPARALARRVAAAGLATEVTGDCMSACTLVFMAADRRRLGPDARLGFHSYITQDATPLLDPRAEQGRDRTWLAGRGLPAGFLDRIEATAHDRMWFPDRATLRAAGVLTD